MILQKITQETVQKITQQTIQQSPQKKTNKVTTFQVYYNSACPVCEKGINWQKTKMTACDISWVNIDSNNERVDEINKALNVVRKYLHIVEGEHVYIGFEAVIKLWENSLTELWKAKFCSLPVIKHIGIYLYFAFANVLYAWNKLCRRW